MFQIVTKCAVDNKTHGTNQTRHYHIAKCSDNLSINNRASIYKTSNS